MVFGCAERADDAVSEQERLEQEAARQNESDSDSESGSEDVDVLDDERSVARRVADATIAAKVRLALVDAETLRPFDFDPVVVNGHVLLRGEVRTLDERMQAENVTKSVSGVRDVINEVSATEEPMAQEQDPSRDSLLAWMEEAAEPEAMDARTAGSGDVPSSDGGEPTSPPTQGQADENQVVHTVRSGDSLWEIARRYGVSVDQITRLNDLRSNRLMPGQQLRIE